MDQQKIGRFLKTLRKEKGLTQEQLAEQFSVSSRTVSRWETGSNMPDVGMLVELADFYDVDLREIIDGERKSEMMDRETKATLKKVAEYATERETGTKHQVINIALAVFAVLFVCTILFVGDFTGFLYGIVLEEICVFILVLAYGSAAALFVSYLKVRLFREKPSVEPERVVVATISSKEIKQGTNETGRSVMGYSFLIHFRTEDGQNLDLFAHEIEYGGLQEGMKGTLSYQGRYFVDFKIQA